MNRPRANALAAILVTLGLVTGCSLLDPDARSRDQTGDQAQQIARQLELPPGYNFVAFRHDKAETPQENRGAGQQGSATIEYESEPKTPAEVMADFDQFFLELGYQRAGESPRSKCREELFNMSWVTPSGVLVYVSYLTGRDVHYLVVPYSYEGLAPVPDDLGWMPSCGASPDE